MILTGENKHNSYLILSKSLMNSRAKPRYALGEYMPATKYSVNRGRQAKHLIQNPIDRHKLQTPSPNIPQKT